MTAEDTTQERTGPATGAVPRPRPAVPSEPPTAETEEQAAAGTEEQPAGKGQLNPAFAEFREEVRKVIEVRDPAPAHHAATRRTGLHRRAAVAAGRGVSTVLMGAVQSLWRVGAWRRTPVGGFVLPLVTLLVVVALAVAAGA
ncbi:MAG TPA: hypothetical protein VHA75_05095, partial [Rugosimonospora sp.]|nr:hypothetical protein [Rugosimonospora sp.]